MEGEGLAQLFPCYLHLCCILTFGYLKLVSDIRVLYHCVIGDPAECAWRSPHVQSVHRVCGYQ